MKNPWNQSPQNQLPVTKLPSYQVESPVTDHCSLITVHCSEWCIVSEIHEFSCTVKIYQGEITIRLENLRLIDYSTADCEALAKLCDRLHNLYSQDLEETAVALVDLLAKLNRPYLTALEEKLLVLLETE